MTVSLMTLLNMIGPSSQNFLESIILWMSNVALILGLVTKCALRSEPLTHVNSCGVAIQIIPTFVRLKRDPHLMGLNVLLENGATRVTACGRMLINKNKMATGGHGPNLAPVPGPVELVFISEHASAIIQCPSMAVRIVLALILSTSFVIQKNAKSTSRTSGHSSASSVTPTLSTRMPNTTGCHMNIPTPGKDATFTVNPKRLEMSLI